MAIKGTDQRILVAEFNFSDNISGIQYSQDQGLEDSTTLGDGWRERTPTIGNANININGFFDATAGKSDPVLVSVLGSANGSIATYFPSGFGTIGNRAVLITIREANLSRGGEVAGLVTLTSSLESEGEVGAGVVLHAFAAETGTTASTSVNNGADTTNGGIAQVHCTAFSGTSVTPKIQHSDDDAIWVDLVSFAAISAPTSERVSVAAGTTVEQYLRETRTGTFTSATLAVTFARRN